MVDEKCRQINKNGTSHDSALHLAQWMKGQFDESVIEVKMNGAAPPQCKFKSFIYLADKKIDRC